jgi:hypothetical protein
MVSLWIICAGRPLSKREVAQVVHQHRSKKQRHIDPDALRQYQLEQLPPEGRLQLEKLKERAMAAPRQPVISPPVPAANWIAVVRLALLATRAFNVNAYLFSPQLSWPQRVCQAGRFLRHIQRTKSFLRYAQNTRNKEFSR